MNNQDILSKVDHTLLSKTATWEEIKEVIDQGIRFGCASVCIPPSFVKQAQTYANQRIYICTVIGFPNGYNTTAVKCFEAAEAVKEGADEIDMVINLGWVKEERFDDILSEINQVKVSCNGKLLKVIIETCLLNDEEIKRLCQVVSQSDADYIKTSTGFDKGGATLRDIDLMKANVTDGLKVKAAGGISGLEDARAFLEHGADRLGTSRVVKALL